jgi:hypothetical protein
MVVDARAEEGKERRTGNEKVGNVYSFFLRRTGVESGESEKSYLPVISRDRNQTGMRDDALYLPTHPLSHEETRLGFVYEI